MKKIMLGLVAFLAPLCAQQYKIAVIGLVHGHAWGHVPAMVKSNTVKLVGISERNPDLVAEAKKLAPGVPVYDDYIKMLDETKPDIVWSFVENNRHLEIAKACAPRKINLMYEKPLASTYKDAEQIRQLAAKYNIRVMTNYQMAWWPANYTARAQVDAGEIGKVWRLHGVVGHGGPGSDGPRNSAFFAWLTDPVQNGAGSLVDFGCYNALWSLWYMGRPAKVYAQVNHLRPERFPKVEDNADLMLSYPNGVGIFEGSWDLPASYQDLEVFGLSGSVYMKNGKVTLHKSGRGSQATDVNIDPLPPERAHPIDFMVQAIRADKPIEGLTALDINVGVVEIIEAAKESVKTGRAVELAKR